jgi:hypothetical protein
MWQHRHQCQKYFYFNLFFSLWILIVTNFPFFLFVSYPFLSDFVLWFLSQNLWFQFLIIMVWRLGGRHSSIQPCISYFQGNYGISIISDCFHFVHLFSWTKKSIVAFDAQPTKLCFGELLIHIFYLLFNDRCNIKV